MVGMLSGNGVLSETIGETENKENSKVEKETEIKKRATRKMH